MLSIYIFLCQVGEGVGQEVTGPGAVCSLGSVWTPNSQAPGSVPLASLPQHESTWSPLSCPVGLSRGCRESVLGTRGHH